MSIDFSEETLSEEPAIIPLDIEGVCVHRELKKLIEKSVGTELLIFNPCQINEQKSDYFHLLAPFAYELFAINENVAHRLIEDYAQVRIIREQLLAIGCLKERKHLQELFFSKDLFLQISGNPDFGIDKSVFVEIPLYEATLTALMSKSFDQVSPEWVDHIPDKFLNILRYEELFSILEFFKWKNDMLRFNLFETRLGKRKLTFEQKKKIIQMKKLGG